MNLLIIVKFVFSLYLYQNLNLEFNYHAMECLIVSFMLIKYHFKCPNSVEKTVNIKYDFRFRYDLFDSDRILSVNMLNKKPNHG